MWVCSQNKEYLLKVNCLFIQRASVFSYKIIEYDRGTIAEYSTKEKALKVLDMIQEHIKNMYIGTGTYMGKPFQMPQDSEVE